MTTVWINTKLKLSPWLISFVIQRVAKRGRDWLWNMEVIVFMLRNKMSFISWFSCGIGLSLCVNHLLINSFKYISTKMFKGWCYLILYFRRFSAFRNNSQSFNYSKLTYFFLTSRVCFLKLPHRNSILVAFIFWRHCQSNLLKIKKPNRILFNNWAFES